MDRVSGLSVFRADLHIHTVLSPCGDIEMTPRHIVAKAKACGLDIIGISDHNTTRQCAEVKKVGERENLLVLCGAEVTTREEVHCLAFFETPAALAAFQCFLDARLPAVENRAELFGYQLLIDEYERVLETVPYLLITALTAGLDEVAQEVHRLDGIFIPAHIDKARNGLLSQLGFVPPALQAEALELSPCTATADFIQQYPSLAAWSFIHSSDAHVPDEIGRACTELLLRERNFKEIKNALHDGRMARKSMDGNV
ncbi:MAG: PHP domain-containing protein [Prevotellaceae bacterium]|jgi:PHP family Zn ribbon phosphoesterase|nr:PHP domain-containing protein [Prevotellaceae bacterium]